MTKEIKQFANGSKLAECLLRVQSEMQEKALHHEGETDDQNEESRPDSGHEQPKTIVESEECASDNDRDSKLEVSADETANLDTLSGKRELIEHMWQPQPQPQQLLQQQHELGHAHMQDIAFG